MKKGEEEDDIMPHQAVILEVHISVNSWSRKRIFQQTSQMTFRGGGRERDSGNQMSDTRPNIAKPPLFQLCTPCTTIPPHPEDRVSQLKNLVSNAIKPGQPGPTWNISISTVDNNNN